MKIETIVVEGCGDGHFFGILKIEFFGEICILNL